jgi:hypothetical protein
VTVVSEPAKFLIPNIPADPGTKPHNSFQYGMDLGLFTADAVSFLTRHAPIEIIGEFLVSPDSFRNVG